MIPIVKSVITPSSQLFQSISDFFFSGCFRFLLLICFSPPVYNISYGVPYVKCFIHNKKEFFKYIKGTSTAAEMPRGKDCIEMYVGILPHRSRRLYAFGYILIIQRHFRLFRPFFILFHTFLNTHLGYAISDNLHCAACRSASQLSSRSLPAYKTFGTHISSARP